MLDTEKFFRVSSLASLVNIPSNNSNNKTQMTQWLAQDSAAT